MKLKIKESVAFINLLPLGYTSILLSDGTCKLVKYYKNNIAVYIDYNTKEIEVYRCGHFYIPYKYDTYVKDLLKHGYI